MTGAPEVRTAKTGGASQKAQRDEIFPSPSMVITAIPSKEMLRPFLPAACAVQETAATFPAASTLVSVSAKVSVIENKDSKNSRTLALP